VFCLFSKTTGALLASKRAPPRGRDGYFLSLHEVIPDHICRNRSTSSFGLKRQCFPHFFLLDRKKNNIRFPPCSVADCYFKDKRSSCHNCFATSVQLESVFKVDANADNAADTASQLIDDSKLSEGNRETFVEQLTGILAKVG